MRTRAFLIGIVVGLYGGFLALELPPLGVVIVVAAAIAPPRPTTAAGVLIGTGLGMAALLLLGASRCTADSGCTAPDLTGWAVAVALCVGVGLVLAVRAGRMSIKPSA
jgi:hypothetical protein